MIDLLMIHRKVRKVLFCSGKIYFELAERQQKKMRRTPPSFRLEQLYPLPAEQLEKLEEKYNKATWFWVQEEPLNMGAASYLQMNLKTINYGVISRQPSAATARVTRKCMRRSRRKLLIRRLRFKF